MRELELVVRNRTGLHARPAKVFVNTVKQFESDIRVRHSEKQVNAKSLISVLTLGVEAGATIFVEVDGADEDEASEAIEQAVLDGLGEEIVVEEETADTVPETEAEPETAREPEIEGASNVVKGVPAAPGIAIGPLLQFKRGEISVDEESAGTEEEKERLQKALEEARAQISGLHDQVSQQTGAEEAEIFAAHLEILSDPDLLGSVRSKIYDGQSAAQAWQTSIDKQAEALAGLDNPLLAERATDVRDVGQRVLRLLVNSQTPVLSLPDEPVILVAKDLTPSETVTFDPERVLGFCTATGGPNSHAAILARALGVPAVVGAGDPVLELGNGAQAILNGQAGTLTLDPDEATLATAREARKRFKAQRSAAEEAADEPAITEDGHHVEIVANIGDVADAERAAEAGAEGVGLLRTEFLFLDRTEPPTEDEQFEVYRDIAQALKGQPVIVRTLDVGGDKPLPYVEMPEEDNPFLGERGIRLCLARPDLLRRQLRAILRAAEYGDLRIMLPMVSDISEWRAARDLLEEVRAELDAPDVEAGIMIEVPSAALMADVLAKEVDFFSIGTNDLTQYTLAMDRMHPNLASQADGLHPAVLRLVKHTTEAAHAEGKWVGVCGELGADPQAVPILVGLGVDELSVNVPAVPIIKAQIRSLTLAEAKERAEQALTCSTAKEVREGATTR